MKIDVLVAIYELSNWLWELEFSTNLHDESIRPTRRRTAVVTDLEIPKQKLLTRMHEMETSNT